jgi:CheY-like chemotaxis protein
LTFKADPAQLVMDFDAEFFEKVLNNLLSNAVKFTPPGGAIQVKAQRTGPFLNIEVIDSGTGIEADKLPYIFERYYQADNSVTRRSEGTGIGLALVKELVDLLEGSIQVSSKPGQETIFTLCLPIRNLSPTKEEITPMGHWESKYAANLSIMQDDDSEYEMTKPSVIIIEDNPAVASFAASCLKEKYQVLTITNSRQGLDAVLEQLPDLVICDIMMPELDGYQVCAAIKSDERSSHIPVMFLSAVTEQADRLKRLNAGADAYVSKPFREEELQTVAAHLHQTRAHLREKYLALASVQESTAIATKPPHESLNPFEVEFLQKAKSLVLAKIQESEFDGNELARALNFSSSQLHRKLSALTGLPAGRYIYRIRLEVAKDLLQRKDLTIAEIAYQVGFSDPAYFTKMFTKEFGQSPSKYRG